MLWHQTNALNISITRKLKYARHKCIWRFLLTLMCTFNPWSEDMHLWITLYTQSYTADNFSRPYIDTFLKAEYLNIARVHENKTKIKFKVLIIEIYLKQYYETILVLLFRLLNNDNQCNLLLIKEMKSKNERGQSMMLAYVK